MVVRFGDQTRARRSTGRGAARLEAAENQWAGSPATHPRARAHEVAAGGHPDIIQGRDRPRAGLHAWRELVRPQAGRLRRLPRGDARARALLAGAQRDTAWTPPARLS